MYHHQFMIELASHSDNKDNPIPEWEYCGGDTSSHLRYYSLRCKGTPMPQHEEQCICSHHIVSNCYIRHRRSREMLVIGSCCIKRFMGGCRKECTVCGMVHKNRVHTLCNVCRTRQARAEKRAKNTCTVCGGHRTGRKDTYCVSCRGGTFRCGKYKNKSFRWVKEHAYSYYRWAVANRVNQVDIWHNEETGNEV